MLTGLREYRAPIAAATLSFVWGWMAGATASMQAALGRIDIQFAVAIAAIPIMIGTFVVLSRSLRAEKLLSHGLRQEQIALDTHCIVSMTDRQSRLTHANRTLLRLTGYARGELIGQPVSKLYFEDEFRKFEAIRAQVESGTTWSGEICVKCKDGTALWTHATVMPRYDTKGRLTGTLSVRTDITASKIATSDREFSQVMHKFSDEVYVFEPGTYRFIYMNERAMKRLGWDRETYQTKSLQDAEPNFNAERFDRLVSSLLDGSNDRIEMRVALAHRPHDATIQLIRPEAGSPKFVTIFRDASQKAEAERIKNEFIATVSHELRSPLTSVKGALGLALSGAAGDLPDKARSLLDIAHRNVDRLVLIVNDILDLEKIAAGKMEFDFASRNLCELISDAIMSQASGAARFDVSVGAIGTDRAAFARFDNDRMMQVMLNLISNAVKFSDPGGEVLVRLSSSDEAHTISVEDSGVGIPEEALARIFDRFSQAGNQTERSGSGTGLGLSIVKAIVESHGGSVSIESEVGVGTKVQVELPKVIAVERPLPMLSA